MSPSQKKVAVAHGVQQRLCSVRRACTYLSLPRSTYRYVPKPLTDRQEQLYQRIIALSWHYPRYGYRRIRALLAREGWTVSRKQVKCIRRRERLNVRPKPKKIPRRGVSTGLPTQATHRHHVTPKEAQELARHGTLELTMPVCMGGLDKGAWHR